MRDARGVALTGMLKAVNVVHELRRHGTFVVNVGPFTNVWTPEAPRPRALAMGFYQMPGRGRVEYSMDGDGEVVRMRWEPKRGSLREWAGPVPVVATPTFEARSHRSVIVAWAVFVGVLVAGTGLGAASGSVIGGLGAGALGGYFVAFTIWGGSLQKAFLAAHEELRRPATPESTEVPGRGGADQPTREPIQAGRHDSAMQRRHRRALRVTYTISVAMVALGFSVGYLLAGGSPQRRFIGGGIGILAGMTLAVVVSDAARIALAIRSASRKQKRAKTSR